jgi:hypothetical protein
MYKVVHEIEVEANDPLDAARKVQGLMQNEDNCWQFYVQDEQQRMFSVDLEEEPKDAVLSIMFYKPLIVNPGCIKTY